MNSQKRARLSPPALGGVSLLVVFAVLCLTVFALLSLTTVQSGSRLADKSVQAVSNYYAADYEAQHILARLRAGERPPEVTATGNRYSYFCPVSETQNLEVELELRGTTYTILRWQVVPTGSRSADERPHPWSGD